jgi:hypothetical protein
MSLKSECKEGSSCSIFHKLSENYNLENSPWGGGEHGLLVAQGLETKFNIPVKRYYSATNTKPEVMSP